MNAAQTTLAILYADIRDSVRLYERVGDAEAHRLARRSMQLMVDITLRHDGIVIRTQGDGVMSIFPSAATACDVACEMQTAHRSGPVSIKVGFNYGRVIEGSGDVYGDAVNLAARVTGLARSGEILTTAETVAALSLEQRLSARLLDHKTVKGKSEPVRIYSLLNEEECQAATTFGQVPDGLNLPPRMTLTLEHRGNRIDMQGPAPPLVLGRSAQCRLVVNNDLASRRHAIIEPKRDHFVITDQSTNGTFVVTQNGEQLFLKRESTRLIGSGVISLGSEPDDKTEDVIGYSQCSD